MVAKVRERLAASKQESQNFDVERFNLRKLNELEVRKQYQIEISNRFTALENLLIARTYIRLVLFNILTEFGIRMKLVRLITMCMNETYDRFRVGKHLTSLFPIRNCLKQGDV
jgi:hypothetical protein